MLMTIIQFFQAEYTLDLLDIKDAFHVDVVRSKMTQNMAIAIKEGREELIMAMDDVIPMRGGTWKAPRRKAMVHRKRRVGYSTYSRDPSTRALPHHESYFCRCFSLFVTIFPFYDPFSGM